MTMCRSPPRAQTLIMAAVSNRNGTKCLARFPDIPVFGRLFAETDFDLHWVVEAAVSFCLCRPILRQLQIGHNSMCSVAAPLRFQCAILNGRQPRYATVG